MKWLSSGESSSKIDSNEVDSTKLLGAEEANVAFAVARDNERERASGEVKLVEQRILLTEMAARLRIALFAEVRSSRSLTKFKRTPHVCAPGASYVKICCKGNGKMST